MKTREYAAVAERALPASPEVARQLEDVGLKPQRGASEAKPLGVFALEEYRRRFNSLKSVESASGEGIDRAAKDVRLLYSVADPDLREFVDYQLGEVSRVMKRLLTERRDDKVAGEIFVAMSDSRNMNDLRLALGNISLKRDPEALRMLAEVDSKIEANRRQAADRGKKRAFPGAASMRKAVSLLTGDDGPRRSDAPARADALGIGGFRLAFKDVKSLQTATPSVVDAAGARLQAQVKASKAQGAEQASERVSEITGMLKSLVGGGVDHELAGHIYRSVHKSRDLEELRVVLSAVGLERNAEAARLASAFVNEELRREKASAKHRR
jgi:hypothetical protein